jgi:hypothetical protein
MWTIAEGSRGASAEHDAVLPRLLLYYNIILTVADKQHVECENG